jgi:HEAT repeat protein
MKRAVILIIVTALVGCGKSPPPQAGGKPISHWLKAMHDPDARVRTQAALKLGNVGSTDSQALPALIEALGDPESSVRRAAIDGLVKYGSSAKDAIPALERLRDGDADPQLRELASKALHHIQE